MPVHIGDRPRRKHGSAHGDRRAAEIHHIDLAVADVERSLTFYLELLGPLGWAESARYPTYRGTEEVICLNQAGDHRLDGLGLRPADGGAHRYYGVGIEHFAIEVVRVEVFCWPRGLSE
jgi:catechol 2,3-dioxygenase-like lactoylglutathione lyase family enzyme